MAPATYTVLILCTGNSARSIMGEYLVNLKGAGRFKAQSAGSHPNGTVNPLALWVLRDRYGIVASGARSKSWEEFKDVRFDFVITVCDSAKESCPIWPGHPVVAHWGSPDPAAATGTDEERKSQFILVAEQIARRIDLLRALPDSELGKRQLDRIGNEA